MNYVVGDIHGRYDELIKAIDEAGIDFDNGDHLYCLGDYVNRGDQSYEVLDYLMNNQKHITCICGNHDDALLEFLYRYYDDYTGSFSAADLYDLYGDDADNLAWLTESGASAGWIKRCRQFLFDMPVYLEVDGVALVHAGFDDNVPGYELGATTICGPFGRQRINTLLWVRDRWILNRKPAVIPVICAHTPVEYVHWEDVQKAVGEDNVTMNDDGSVTVFNKTFIDSSDGLIIRKI